MTDTVRHLGHLVAHRLRDHERQYVGNMVLLGHRRLGKYCSNPEAPPPRAVNHVLRRRLFTRGEVSD